MFTLESLDFLKLVIPIKYENLFLSVSLNSDFVDYTGIHS